MEFRDFKISGPDLSRREARDGGREGVVDEGSEGLEGEKPGKAEDMAWARRSKS